MAAWGKRLRTCVCVCVLDQLGHTHVLLQGMSLYLALSSTLMWHKRMGLCFDHCHSHR